MQPVRRIAQRADHSEHHRQRRVGSLPSQPQLRLLGGEPSSAYRLDADDVARLARGLEKFADERPVGGTIGSPSVQPLS
jgi:hypothetical protein